MDTSRPDRARRERVLVERLERIMGTEVSIQLATWPDQLAAADTAADAALMFLREVDARLSRFRPDSELSQLNLHAGEWFQASDMLFAVVTQALSAAQNTQGLFDPTLLVQIRALGYDRDFAEIAHQTVTSLGAPFSMPVVGEWRAVQVDPVQQRIFLPEGCGLDLGGIAKGWAADVALERYCADFPGALINVGGDLRAQGGPQPGKAWTIGVPDPRGESSSRDDHDLAIITMSRGGLATSGALRRWWWQDGERQHHLLDPRTGRPAALWIDAGTQDMTGHHTLATATALAPTAAQAEVAAKVALLRGVPGALQTVEEAWDRFGALMPRGEECSEAAADIGVALFMTFGTGEFMMSHNMQEYLASWGTEGGALPMRLNSWAMWRSQREDDKA